jgi:2-keto-4-pentenoate hydratase
MNRAMAAKFELAKRQRSEAARDMPKYPSHKAPDVREVPVVRFEPQNRRPAGAPATISKPEQRARLRAHWG